MSLKLLAAIAVAGAVGTLLRYSCIRLGTVLTTTAFPFSTLIVNVIGAFAAGAVCALIRGRFPQFAPLLPVILVGFLGAFTTFSTYALECAELFHRGAAGKALLNLLLQNTLGILAAWGGLVAGSRFSA